MFTGYVLHSPSSKTYIGFTNSTERRLTEHNITEGKGFTLRHRPWMLIHTEEFEPKSAAMIKEKFYKTGKGRSVVQHFVADFSANSK